MPRITILVFLGALGAMTALGCQPQAKASQLSQDTTFAELRSVKGALTVTAAGEAARAPYPRERLIDGEVVELPADGLAWMRRDGGATWLVSGPARLTLHAAGVELTQGRAFVDTEAGDPATVTTPRGTLELSDARASVDVGADGSVSTYVLRGSVRAPSSAHAESGERLDLLADGQTAQSSVVSWQDWTGGLGTADPAADPAPFGIGTVGARQPGDKGRPRFSLVIQRLDVKVSIDHDFALTQVDQTFVNPSSDTVEGLFRFRTPPRAVLERFGVDRDGDLVWGRVKESAEAVQQYERNVYAGSAEDPALLQWQGAGVYEARLYPIPPGAQRRVVTTYAEWLPRHGPNAERRLYVYPMAAEGAKGSLPRIEELTVTFDLTLAAATAVRAGMGGTHAGNTVVVKAFDVVPRADLALELYDSGQRDAVAYRAPHALGPEDAPESGGKDFAKTVSREEADYLAIPLRAPPAADAAPGLDLALVIDTSAATEPSALAIARSMAAALLAHLGPDDRAALWVGDATLRPVAAGSGSLVRVDAEMKKQWLAGLGRVERGGATDLGALLTEAASQLDPKRRGAVVYVGDGVPSVGELVPRALSERLLRLPASARVLAAAVGSQPNLPVLESVVRGAPVEQVADAYGAARSALRLLEAAGRALWLDPRLDLGPNVERVLPHTLPPILADETIMVVGRVIGPLPTRIGLSGSGGSIERPLSVRWLKDHGDLRRRWGEERLLELIDSGAGRASLVDLGRRFGLVSPVTSLYVPTRREEASVGEDSVLARDQRQQKLERWKPWASGGSERSEAASAAPSGMALRADNQEGGTGTRAKGEELAAALAPSPASPPSQARATALREAMAFGSIGSLGQEPSDNADAPGMALAVSPEAARGGAAPRADKELEPTSPSPESDVDRYVHGNVVSLAKKGQGFGLSGAYGARVPQAPMGKTAAAPGVAPPTEASIPEWPAHVVGGVGHERSACGPGADLPFPERRGLWRERIGVQEPTQALIQIYTRTLRDCEARDRRERSALLLLMVDSLVTTRERVDLWRALLGLSPAAADTVYRALLLRVQTSSDLKELHDALGLQRIDPLLLESLLKKADSSAKRLAILRGAAEKFGDDTELALLVLDAYEDAEDDAGGRAWARKLRRRADATAHVRTNVGEYYLRLASRGTGLDAERDTDEGRRTFGELVEFAPEDPLARRRLGDLLGAHGWYEEALRQYQTLATLTPDDPSVPLLLASAAQGTGKVEEAVRWLEKAAASAAPEGRSDIALAARALASAFLAWARDDSARARANAANGVNATADADGEIERLRARAARLLASEQGQGVRVLLSWSHPELRPALWTDALGSMMPARDNLPLLGVAQAFVSASPAPHVELRLDPEDAARAARLGAKARLTLLIAEGTGDERIARVEVGFKGKDGKPRESVAYVLSEGALVEVAP